jgi:hypothetical protein
MSSTAQKKPTTKNGHTRTGFNDRLTAAADAKKALLERFKRPDPNDPAWVAQQEALKATAEAREARMAERKAAKEAEAIRAAAEEIARREAEKAQARAKMLAEEAERKAIRDARYAARKARKLPSSARAG